MNSTTTDQCEVRARQPFLKVVLRTYLHFVHRLAGVRIQRVVERLNGLSIGMRQHEGIEGGTSGEGRAGRAHAGLIDPQ